jgi:alpha-1,3-rhamnosyl/mannosyltransferase
MRVAVDTNAVYTGQAGVARYVRGLITGFASLPEPLDYFEFAWKVENFKYRQPQRALKTFYREFVWARLLANSALRRSGANLLHSTGGPLFLPTKSVRHVTTLHDLAVLRHPERFRKWQLASIRWRLGRYRSAEKIVCDSRFTADEAIELLGLPASKLVVVDLGCEFQDGESLAETPPATEVPKEFLLFVGSLEPGKNLNLIKEVYRLAESKGVRLPPLVIVGSRWSGVPGEGPPPPNWHYLGRQPDATLVYLYRRALVLLFPSKYEGFGFPIVEAMCLRCPVICSKVACLPDTAGDAAIYAELTAESYLSAIGRLLREEVSRKSLIDLGLAHSARFTWARCARETVQVYRSVCP